MSQAEAPVASSSGNKESTEQQKPVAPPTEVAEGSTDETPKGESDEDIKRVIDFINSILQQRQEQGQDDGEGTDAGAEPPPDSQ